MKKSKSFKRELITSFLAIGITSIIILGSFQIFQLYSLVEEKQNNQIAQTAFMEDYINSYVDTHTRLIETLSAQLADDFSAGDFDSIRQNLREAKNHYPGFVNLYLGDPDGQALFFYPDVLTNGVIEENLNFSDRDYYQDLIENETSVISPVFHGRGGTDLLLVAIVSPIFDQDNNMQGYLLGALDLNQLDNYAGKRINDETTTAVVIDQENNAIVHPSVNTGRELTNYTDSEIIKRIEQDEASGSFTFHDGEKRQFVTYGKIEPLGWTVWISNPVMSIVGAFLDSIFAVVLVALVTAVIVIITSLILTNRLENAIRELLHYINTYTNSYKNNEATALTEEIQGPTEINEVLVHFNGMMEKIDANRKELVELNTELEQRVQERTANLENKVRENKLLFEQFRFKHAELEAVLESMFEGIMLLDNNHQIKYVNEFFLQVIAKHAKKPPAPLRTFEDITNQLLVLFDVGPGELETFFDTNDGVLQLTRKEESGKEIHYLLHQFSVTSEADEIGFGLLIQDVTTDVEIDILKDNLISLTSHEFKTPITTIKGSVETLLRKEVEWDEDFQTELLEGVLEDIGRIQQLVDDWMDISKIESGSMYIEPTIIRADQVIEESIRLIPPELRENAAITFQHEAEENLVFYADRGRVQQVLVNLITNGLRYNDSIGKKVDITLNDESDFIMIAVADNGIGIAKEHMERIFNRFYQVDSTATRRSGGTGLGLAIVEGIIEAHHGKIEVESKLGKGSVFRIYFKKEVKR